MIKIVKIYGTHCYPCKLLVPILEKIKQNYSDVIIEEVNIDDGVPQEYQDLNIMQTPTLIFYKDDKIISTLSGLQTYEKIEQQIKNV